MKGSYYRVAIGKQTTGSAIKHTEPVMQGNVIIKVTDSSTAGDYKLFVIESSDAQNQANLSVTGVEELSEEQAIELAPEYQPARTLTQLNPLTMEEEKVDIPVCDLRVYLRS